MIEKKLNDYEAFRVGINLEKQGIEFYTKYADVVKNTDTRTTMLKLAEDEKEHLQLFEELSKEVGDEYKGQPLINDELIRGYLATLIDADVFSEAPPEVEGMNEEEALKFAMNAEKDSILFYYDAYKYSTNKSGREAFGRLINEEQKHFMLLKDMVDKINK